jgi:YggT family protein
MIDTIIIIIDYISLAINLLLIAYVVLSYFMDPYHPVRMTVNRIVNPILDPIRRLLPQSGNVDFSPIVAIIAVYIIEYLLTQVLRSFAG